uniref:Protein kinase n=1 Tax=Pithovirus LCPAC101 TaxID=2506586 RepID=A0A481Z2N3_9VIRU|nr:MAG: protein kinase [Pithovirus LCPAC101]
MECKLDPVGPDQSMDNYLLYFDKIRDKILKLLLITPKEISSYLWNPEYSPLIDLYCQCDIGSNVDEIQMTKKKEYTKIFNRITSRYNRCTQCSLFHRLMKDGQGNNEIVIKNNGKIERVYTLDRHESLSLMIKWQKYNKVYRNNGNDSGKQTYIGFLLLDSFTCSILSNWYIEAALSSWDIPGLANVETGYVCSNNGYIMKEKPSLPSWSSITKNYLDNSRYDDHPLVIISLWIQLFSILHVLSKHNFDNPSFSDMNINLQVGEVYYEYDNIQINNNVMIKLNFQDGCDVDVYMEPVKGGEQGKEQGEEQGGDQGYESILKDGKEKYRIYKTNKMDTILNKKPFSITTRNINYVNCNQDDFCISTERCYVQVNEGQFSSYLKQNKSIPNMKENISVYKRYINYGLIPNSVVTVYMCILTMMTDIHTYQTVMANDELYDFWKELWHPLDFDSIHSRIKNMVPSDDIITPDDLLKIIILSRLRCDVADYAWSSIKNIYNMNIDK